MTARILRAAARGLALLALPLLVAAPGARAQCDPDADWVQFSPTGDIAEILVQDRIGWIAADGGLIRIDLAGIAGGAPQQRKITDNEGLISTDVTCMAQDGFGNVWVGTRDDGLSVFTSAGDHIADLSSFGELWSDQVTAIGADGSRVFVVSVDQFTPQGNPEGGGFVIIDVAPDGAGGWTFDSVGGPSLEVGQVVLPLGPRIWFGTSGDGLWLRDETVQPATFGRVLAQVDGLASNNVKDLLSAPHPGFAGDVLWIGTGAGLQVYDGDSLATVSAFGTENILDVYYRSGSMLVLSEAGSVRDLWRLDLSVDPPVRVPIRKSDCVADSSYVPREVAVDVDGRIVLGTRTRSFSVYEGGTWYCPPPLGPHAPQVADLAVGPDGALYFGTGSRATDTKPGDGIGIFRDGVWTSLTRDDGILEREMVWIETWPDSSVWFGSRVDANTGGLNRWFPQSDSLQAFTPDVVDATRRTLGRNVGNLRLDAGDNLWVLYGQNGGGFSVIEWPSGRVTNYPVTELDPQNNDLLSAIAFDSRGRAWIGTRNTDAKPGELLIVDTGGTLASKIDDEYTSYLLASEVADLGDINDIEIDANDTIWLLGERGIALGQIGPDQGGEAFATWITLSPTASQLGGRNPLPWSVAEFDWNGDLWIGSEASGVVRVTPDAQQWKWYDQVQGCPLPDANVTGLFADRTNRRMWVATLTGGITRIDLARRSAGSGGDARDPQPFPNPYRPDADGSLGFAAVPLDETATLRIWTLAGELVWEGRDLVGEKTWNGRNLGDQIVETGIYLVTGTSSSGLTFEGKVAVLR